MSAAESADALNSILCGFQSTASTFALPLTDTGLSTNASLRGLNSPFKNFPIGSEATQPPGDVISGKPELRDSHFSQLSGAVICVTPRKSRTAVGGTLVPL